MIRGRKDGEGHIERSFPRRNWEFVYELNKADKKFVATNLKLICREEQPITQKDVSNARPQLQGNAHIKRAKPP